MLDAIKFINWMLNNGTLPMLSKKRIDSLWKIYCMTFSFKDGNDTIVAYYHHLIEDLWNWEIEREYEEVCMR